MERRDLFYWPFKQLLTGTNPILHNVAAILDPYLSFLESTMVCKGITNFYNRHKSLVLTNPDPILSLEHVRFIINSQGQPPTTCKYLHNKVEENRDQHVVGRENLFYHQ